MTDKLKPCPFCGGSPSHKAWSNPSGEYGPGCTECGVTADSCAVWNSRAQLPSQGGEAVEVVAWQDAENPLYTTAERRVMHDWAGNGYPIVELMTVAQHQRILAAQRIKTCIALKERNDAREALTHPADQVADDLTMVKVSRELLQDLRDLAFDQVEHHRAAMGAYKQTRQSAMDSVLAQADALLEVKP